MSMSDETVSIEQHEPAHRKERSIAWPLLYIAIATTAIGFELAIQAANSREETASVYGALPDYIHSSGYHDVNRLYADTEADMFSFVTNIEEPNPLYCTGEYPYNDHRLRIVPGSIVCALMAHEEPEQTVLAAAQ